MNILISSQTNDIFKKTIKLCEFYNEMDCSFSNNNPKETKTQLKESSVFIADLTENSVEIGIELGFALSEHSSTFITYKKGKKLSPTIKNLPFVFLEYNDEIHLKEILDKTLNLVKS